MQLLLSVACGIDTGTVDGVIAGRCHFTCGLLLANASYRNFLLFIAGGLKIATKNCYCCWLNSTAVVIALGTTKVVINS